MTERQQRRLRIRVWIAQGMDLCTFAAFFVLVGGSVHAERNPIIAAAYAFAGLAGVGLLKLGLVTAAMRHRPPAERIPGWRGAISRPITHRSYWPAYTILLSIAAASGIVAGINAVRILRGGCTRL